MTPEGKIKRVISKVLQSAGEGLWYDMPVPGGFGGSQLDYTGWFFGLPFVIEAKRLGAQPTDRQRSIMHRMERAGATVFLIDGPDGIAALTNWLNWVRTTKGGATA